MKYQTIIKNLYGTKNIQTNTRKDANYNYYYMAEKKTQELIDLYSFVDNDRLTTEGMNGMLSSVRSNVEKETNEERRTALMNIPVPYIHPIPEEQQSIRAETQKSAYNYFVDSVNKNGHRQGLRGSETRMVDGFKYLNEEKRKNTVITSFSSATKDFLMEEGNGYLSYFNNTPEQTKNLLTKTLQAYMNVCDKIGDGKVANKMSDREFLTFVSKRGLDSYVHMASLTGENLDKIVADFHLGEDEEIKNLVSVWKDKYASVAPFVKDEVLDKIAYMANPIYKVASREDFCLFHKYLQLMGAESVLSGDELVYSDAIKAVEDDIVIGAHSPKLAQGNAEKEKKFAPKVKASLAFYLKSHPECTGEKLHAIDLDDGATDLTGIFGVKPTDNTDRVEEALLKGHKVTIIDDIGHIKSQIMMDATSGKCVEKAVNTLYMTQSGLGFLDAVEDLRKGVNEVNKYVINPTKEFTDMARKLNDLANVSYESKAYNALVKEIVSDAKAYIANKDTTTKPFTAKTFKRYAMAQKIIDSLDGCGLYSYKADAIAEEAGKKGKHDREIEKSYGVEKVYNLRGNELTEKDFDDLEKAYQESKKAKKVEKKEPEQWSDDFLEQKLKEETDPKNEVKMEKTMTESETVTYQALSFDRRK